MNSGLENLFTIKRVFKASDTYLAAQSENDHKQLLAFVSHTSDLGLYYLRDSSSLPVIKKVPWFQSSRKKISALCFDPLGYWLLVASIDGSLYIIPAKALVDEFYPSDEKWTTKDITSFVSLNAQNSYSRPSALVWWQGVSFSGQIGIVGTEQGEIVFVNLETGQIVGSTKIEERVTNLSICRDSNPDTLTLLITNHCRKQWYLILEKPGKHYTYPLSNGGSQKSIFNNERADDDSKTFPTTRSRLRGLKQLSVEKLVTLKQKLAESRFRNNESSGIHPDNNSNKNNSEAGPNNNELFFFSDKQQVENSTSPTAISDKIYVTPHFFKNGRTMYSSYQSSTNLLFVYERSTTLEPLCVYEVPVHCESILLTSNFFYISSGNSIYVVSRLLSKRKNGNRRNSDENSIIVEFTGNKGETMNSMFMLSNTRNDDNSSPPVDTCIKVTNLGVREITLRKDVLSLFMHLIQKRKAIEDVEKFGVVFELEMKKLIEYAGDTALHNHKFDQAKQLYLLAGCQISECILKFASAGYTMELLSYLVDYITSAAANELSLPDRIHFSNLSILAFTECVLRASLTQNKIINENFLNFLTANKFYDELFAINIAVQTNMWNILHHLVICRGLGPQVLDIITSNNPKLHLNQHTHDLLMCLSESNLIQGMLDNPSTAANHICFVLAHLSTLEIYILQRLIELYDPTNAAMRPILLRLKDRRRTASQSSFSSQCDSIDLTEGLDEIGVLIEEIIEVFLQTFLTLLYKKQPSVKFIPECVQFTHLSNIEESQKMKKSSVDFKRRLVSPGFAHTALIRNGNIYTWGYCRQGCLGTGPTISEHSSPQAIGVFRRLCIEVLSISCGRYHTLAVTNNGVYTWGGNKCGQLGLSELCQTPNPEFIKSLSEEIIVDAVAGQHHSTAITEDGRLYTWGWGVYGQLGHGDIENKHRPTLVTSLLGEKVRQVCAGYAHTLALVADGYVYSFGSNWQGQLGVRRGYKHRLPVKISLLPDNIALISTKYFHNLALTSTNELYIWGTDPHTVKLERRRRKKLAGKRNLQKVPTTNNSVVAKDDVTGDGDVKINKIFNDTDKVAKNSSILKNLEENEAHSVPELVSNPTFAANNSVVAKDDDTVDEDVANDEDDDTNDEEDEDETNKISNVTDKVAENLNVPEQIKTKEKNEVHSISDLVNNLMVDGKIDELTARSLNELCNIRGLTLEMLSSRTAKCKVKTKRKVKSADNKTCKSIPAANISILAKDDDTDDDDITNDEDDDTNEEDNANDEIDEDDDTNEGDNTNDEKNEDETNQVYIDTDKVDENLNVSEQVETEEENEVCSLSEIVSNLMINGKIDQLTARSLNELCKTRGLALEMLSSRTEECKVNTKRADNKASKSIPAANNSVLAKDDDTDDEDDDTNEEDDTNDEEYDDKTNKVSNGTDRVAENLNVLEQLETEKKNEVHSIPELIHTGSASGEINQSEISKVLNVSEVVETKKIVDLPSRKTVKPTISNTRSHKLKSQTKEHKACLPKPKWTCLKVFEKQLPANNNNIANTSIEAKTKKVKSKKEEHKNVEKIPTLVDISWVQGKIVQVSTGYRHSALLSKEGTVYTWGYNYEGQLGTRQLVENEEKVCVPTPVYYRKIDVFREDMHNGGMPANDHNSNANTKPKKQKRELLKAVKISCGSFFTVAIQPDGDVLAWGNNNLAQLGRSPTAFLEEGRLINNFRMHEHSIRADTTLVTYLTPIQVSNIPAPTISYESYDVTPLAGIIRPLNFIEPSWSDVTFHYALEQFCGLYNSCKILNKCIEFKNYQACAKLELLEQNFVEAFTYQLRALKECYATSSATSSNGLSTESDQETQPDDILEENCKLFEKHVERNLVDTLIESAEKQKMKMPVSKSLDSFEILENDEELHFFDCQGGPEELFENSKFEVVSIEMEDDNKEKEENSLSSVENSLSQEEVDIENPLYTNFDKPNLDNLKNKCTNRNALNSEEIIIMKLAVNIVDIYLNEVEEDAHSTIHEMLATAINFWIDNKFPMKNLEEVFDKFIKKIYYPLGLLLHGSYAPRNSSSSEKNEKNIVVKDIDKVLSPGLCLNVCSLLREHIEEGKPITEYIELLSMSMAKNYGPPLTGYPGSNENQTPEQMIDGIISTLSGKYYDPRPFIHIKDPDKVSELLSAEEDAMIFTCGHQFLISTYHSEVVPRMETNLLALQSPLPSAAQLLGSVLDKSYKPETLCPTCLSQVLKDAVRDVVDK